MKTMRNIILITTLTLFISINQVQAADSMTLLLDWFVNPDHAPIIIAKEKGFFKDRGIDLEIIAPSNPNDPPKLVAAHKADFAVSYQYQHQIQVDQGLPLLRIATLIATPLNSLVVLDKGPIHTLEDMRGRTIGYSVGGFETVLLKTMLQQAGLTLDDVKLVNVNFSLSPALFTNQADAVIGAFRNFELNQMDIAGKPGRAFLVEEHGIPTYDELIIISHRDMSGDSRLRRFTEALEMGVQYLVNHPEESWNLFTQGARKELDNDLNHRAWKDTLPRFALRPGALDVNRYSRFAAFLQEQGIIKEPPPLAQWAIEPL